MCWQRRSLRQSYINTTAIDETSASFAWHVWFGGGASRIQGLSEWLCTIRSLPANKDMPKASSTNVLREKHNKPCEIIGVNIYQPMLAKMAGLEYRL